MLALSLAGGLLALLVGGEILVRGAVSVARRLSIPPMVIGLTLVGFGTSTPELVTSIQAALRDAPGIAVGNVVGSNIANILLILGIAALLAPIPVNHAAFRRDGTVLAATTLLLAALALSGSLTAPMGAVLLAGLAAYLWLAFRKGSDPAAGEVYEHEAESIAADDPLWRGLLLFAAGLALVLVGANFLVDGAIVLARALGVSETVIGLTIVAVGTSLPELVTSVMAARKGESDVAFGNVVGSNIFNILGILGATALVSPLAVPPEILRLDLWVMIAVTALLIWMARSGWRISRVEGSALVALYAAYLGTLALLA